MQNTARQNRDAYIAISPYLSGMVGFLNDNTTEQKLSRVLRHEITQAIYLIFVLENICHLLVCISMMLSGLQGH